MRDREVLLAVDVVANAVHALAVLANEVERRGLEGEMWRDGRRSPTTEERHRSRSFLACKRSASVCLPHRCKRVPHRRTTAHRFAANHAFRRNRAEHGDILERLPKLRVAGSSPVVRLEENPPETAGSLFL